MALQKELKVGQNGMDFIAFDRETPRCLVQIAWTSRMLARSHAAEWQRAGQEELAELRPRQEPVVDRADDLHHRLAAAWG